MIYTTFEVTNKKELNEAIKDFLHGREVNPIFNISWDFEDIIVDLVC